MAVHFFYDQQIRRFLLQFIRMVSNFQVEFGTTDPATGKLALQTVPVIYGDQSRQAAFMLRPSQNTMSAVPAMAAYITGLRYDRERVQDPFFVSKVNLRERMIDPVTGLPTSQQGDAFTVERLMPVPYRMTVKLDIWTSNTEQKLQLVEQMATLFNPSLEIQSTDNYIDWTSLSIITLTDVNWDSRTVPTGSEDPISIATMTFEIPIWISPPAKLKKLGVVQKIISQAWDSSGQNLTGQAGGGGMGDAIGDPEKTLTRRAWNVMRYGIVYSGNTLQLIKYDDVPAINVHTVDEFNHPAVGITRSGTPDKWPAFLNLYGVVKNGISEIRLEQPNGHEIVGTIAMHPTDPTLLLYEPFGDTLPSNTLQPVNAIIYPEKVNVDDLLIDKLTGNYKVAAGTRFLILKSIGSAMSSQSAAAWTPNGHALIANANDIIEYDGTRWFVSFDSQRTIDAEFVTNVNTNVQFRWNGESWLRSYEGAYREGKWTLIL